MKRGKLFKGAHDIFMGFLKGMENLISKLSSWWDTVHSGTELMIKVTITFAGLMILGFSIGYSLMYVAVLLAKFVNIVWIIIGLICIFSLLIGIWAKANFEKEIENSKGGNDDAKGK